MKTKKWQGSKPICDDCTATITAKHKWFADGMSAYYRQWGIFCPACAKSNQIKFGTGKGQKYDAVTMEKIEG